MTKKDKAILKSYNNSTDFDIFDVYKNPSYLKTNAQTNIINFMKKQHGHGYRVLSHNCFGFVCAFMCKKGLYYFTRHGHRIIKLED